MHLTRREVVGGAATLVLGAGLERLVNGSEGTPTGGANLNSETIAFHGPRQAGVATAAQDHLVFAAFDMRSDAADDLRALLEQWTAAAARLTVGLAYEPSSSLDGSPMDTGEALGLGPSRLTVTVGLGPGIFGTAGHDRFGLAGRRPPDLQQLPAFQGESLDASVCGGDLCLQACADDPQVAFHAVHVLSRLASSAATLRYTQIGFGRTSSTSRKQQTPRNLMGFKDGTANIRSEDTQAMDEFVWIQESDGPQWMANGTYLVARRIKILFDVWDAATLEDQQRTIGREKISGAPLGSQSETDPIDLQATKANGELVIPTNAHVRLASPQYNREQRILRRGYSYCENNEPGSGQLDAGLFFIAFQRSPTRQFIPIQRRLVASDALNQHTLHTSSAIFACPPGARPGGFIGEGLFA
jgi:deferrochelatase/peroxidase EfeB